MEQENISEYTKANNPQELKLELKNMLHKVQKHLDSIKSEF